MGVASAVMGAVQFAIDCTASVFVATLHDGTGPPMVATVAGVAVLSVVSLGLLSRRAAQVEGTISGLDG